MKRFLGECLYNKKMTDGLSVYVLPKQDFNKAFAMYSTHYGSIDNEFIVPDSKERIKVPEGVAHFLEHKMFEMDYGNVFDEFAKMGTSANAFTSYTNTTYLFSATSNFKENLELLMNFVETPYFTEDSVEKEKGIITQELKMYQDNSSWQVFFNLLDCLYHKHPVKVDIGGTVDSIQKIDVDILYDCYKTFYHPSNMVLFVAGAIDKDYVFDIVSKSRKDNKQPYETKIRRIYHDEPETINKSSNKVYLDVVEPIILVGFKDVDVGYDGSKLLEKELTTAILLEIMFGKSSTFYEENYAKGLIDDRFRFSYDGQKDYGFCAIGGETKDPKSLYNKIMDNITKFKKQGIDEEDFIRIKKKFAGGFISGFNSVEFIASSFISNYHKNIHLFDYIKVLKNIKIDGLAKRLNDLFDFSRQAISQVLPKGKVK